MTVACCPTRAISITLPSHPCQTSLSKPRRVSSKGSRPDLRFSIQTQATLRVTTRQHVSTNQSFRKAGWFRGEPSTPEALLRFFFMLSQEERISAVDRYVFTCARFATNSFHTCKPTPACQGFPGSPRVQGRGTLLDPQN